MSWYVRVVFALTLGVVLLVGSGCDDDPSAEQPSGTEDSGAATRRAESSAERPAWFPASFPLVADTTVVSEAKREDGGGVVEFAAPVSAARMLEILALNWEIHDWMAGAPEEGPDGTSLAIENRDYTGTVLVSTNGNESLMKVELTPK